MRVSEASTLSPMYLCMYAIAHNTFVDHKVSFDINPVVKQLQQQQQQYEYNTIIAIVSNNKLLHYGR